MSLQNGYSLKGFHSLTSLTCQPSTMALYFSFAFSLPPSQARHIAMVIGQAFSAAYKQALRASGVKEEQLEQAEYTHILNAQSVSKLEVESLGDRNKTKKVGECVSVCVCTCVHVCALARRLSVKWMNPLRKDNEFSTSYKRLNNVHALI